jgi:hypothetical protein
LKLRFQVNFSLNGLQYVLDEGAAGFPWAELAEMGIHVG